MAAANSSQILRKLIGKLKKKRLPRTDPSRVAPSAAAAAATPSASTAAIPSASSSATSSASSSAASLADAPPAANDGLPNTQPVDPAAAAAASSASSAPASAANTPPTPAASPPGPVASTDATSDTVDRDAVVDTSTASPSAAKATSAANAAVAPSDQDSDDSTASTDKACGANSDAAVQNNLKKGPGAPTDAASYPVDYDAAATSPASPSAAKATSTANAAVVASSQHCDGSTAPTHKACETNSSAAVHNNLKKGADFLKKGSHHEEKMNFDNIITTDVDVSMKANNLLHLIEDISSRFLILEKRTGCLESAVDALICKVQTTVECSTQKPDLESEPFLTQLSEHQPVKKIVYAGIRNQGGTCYLNSIVQTLFHLPLFREIICQIEDIPQGSATSALKSLFYRMKYSNKPACTYELTTSLGWTAKRHEDVVEKFEELLHELMKVPCLKNVVEEIFGGSIRLTDRSIKTEQPFYVLRLKVEGCKNVQASFEDIVREELTAYDAVYNTNKDHSQEATEISLFGHLPPVLILQLGRFESTIKLNDHYEFPLELDLDLQGLSVDSEKDKRKIYTLHSVHVHTSDPLSGHNFVFIRPTLLNAWYKFDDHIVTNATEDMAIQEQYGGHEGPSAYMLVYIRKTESELICNTNLEDLESAVSTYQRSVPSHVKINVGHDLDGIRKQPPQWKLDWCCLSSEYVYSVRVFVSQYLDFGLVVNNLLAYSGFHILLLGLDLLIENRLKNKIFISMWEGLCWLIAVALHVRIIRWINNKSNKTAMTTNTIDSPIQQLEAMLDELSILKTANPMTYIRDLRLKLINLAVSIKKEQHYEDFMLLLLAVTRWTFSVLKEVSSETIGKGFLRLLLPHVGAMAIELIGAFVVFRFIHKKRGAWFTLEWIL